LHYLHRFLQLATGQAATVVWLLPPVSPGTQRIWEHRGSEREFDTQVQSLIRQYPRLLVLDGRHSGYDTSVFHDPTHLDREGAIALSCSVGDLLRHGALSPSTDSRWIPLPAYQGSWTSAPLEDLGQSGRVVLQRLKKRDERRR
jgi:hypothetical protein